MESDLPHGLEYLYGTNEVRNEASHDGQRVNFVLNTIWRSNSNCSLFSTLGRDWRALRIRLAALNASRKEFRGVCEMSIFERLRK
jgi:hypothetical protein